MAAGLGVVIVPPAAALTALKLKDNPLPPVAAPVPVMVEGWLLEAGDPGVERPA